LRHNRKRVNKTEELMEKKRKKTTAQQKHQRMKKTDQQANEDRVPVVESVPDAAAKFKSAMRCGPDYVCTVCHRLLYKTSVIKVNVDLVKQRYSRLDDNLLSIVFAVQHHIMSH